MINWFIVIFQDSNSYTILLLNYLHDHLISLIAMILFIVFYFIFLILCWDFFVTLRFNEQLVESVWTAGPISVLLFIALPSMQALYYTEGAVFSDISIKSVGSQWFWSYEYSGTKIFDCYMHKNGSLFRLLDTSNAVVLPYSFKIQNLVSSTDVIHSWTVPSFGVKVDAVPGRVNQIFFTLRVPGIFFGQCSEICGANHTFMPIRVSVVGIRDYLKLVHH